MRRTLVIGVVCLAAVGLLGWTTAFAGSSAAGSQTIRLSERDTLDSGVDQGAAGPSAADEFFAFGKLRNPAGASAGRFEGACTMISDPALGYARCEATVALSRGQIQIAGEANFNQSTITLAITGGTGAYARATGDVLVTGFGSQVSHFVFHLQTA